ncbi:MAG: hypothetical protein COV45_06985 [Deltaproteobacteria bacterium CG11_big_fil_rev_8_21_14_0_20_47_16]|nr:MAG: hypothetical protein COV45_06985 [Deltaproteobacteria bacterium CG11_big_fil_rev_8_21_14_0_20_47_16]
MPLLAAVVMSQTPAPEKILAQRLERQAQFLKRMGRENNTYNQTRVIKWLTMKGKSNVRN